MNVLAFRVIFHTCRGARTLAAGQLMLMVDWSTVEEKWANP